MAVTGMPIEVMF